MCKILTPKEKEALNKLTRLVESLTNKKVILESKPDCHCCSKKSLKENIQLPSNKQEERFIGYEIKCIDSEGELKALLEYIKSNGNTGHSFGIVVDEGENKKDFYWDGDGLDRIESITPIKESKKDLKEGVWALPKDSLSRRKAMNFKQELQRIKNDIYDIAGSDELFDNLDGAIKELDALITIGKSQGLKG